METGPGGHEVWQAISIDSCPAQILGSFDTNDPDYIGLRTWLSNEFLAQAALLNSFETDKDEGFLRWLVWQEHHSNLWERLVTKRPRLFTLMFLGSASKSIGISQRHCYECSRNLAPDELCPIRNIPLRIDPISWQASSANLKADFKRQIIARLGDIASDFAKHDTFCVSLTFSLNAKSRDRDCDNMAKGLLDALAEAMEVNDNKFVHLDLMKLVFPDCEDHVSVRIGPSGLLRHSDVLVPITRVGWAGTKRMELEGRSKKNRR